MKVRMLFMMIPAFLALYLVLGSAGQWNPLSSVARDTTGPSREKGTVNRHLLFEETLEEGRPFDNASSLETGFWDYALNYVSEPVFHGRRAVRFEIRKDQPLVKNGKRSEVVVVKGANGDISRDAWYSFAAYFPSKGYEYDTTREVINQWYQHGSPATSLRTQSDSFLLETGNTMESRQRFSLGPIEKDTWHRFVLHFIHSHHADGLIEVWHNGKKVLTHHGGNMYDDVMPKWKIGLYKAAFKQTTSLVERRVIYFDNIRVGDKNATFEDMDPGNWSPR